MIFNAVKWAIKMNKYYYRKTAEPYPTTEE